MKEKVPGRWEGLREGDGERPLLHKIGLIFTQGKVRDMIAPQKKKGRKEE